MLLNQSHVFYANMTLKIARPFWRRYTDLASPGSWVELLSLPLLTVVGVVGNVLMLVLMSSRKADSGSFSIIMRALSVADNIVLVKPFLIWCNMISVKYFNTLVAEPVSTLTCLLSKFDLSCHFIATWLIVLLSMERWVKTKYPIQGNILLGRRSTKLAIVVLCVLGLAYWIIPNWFILVAYDGATSCLHATDYSERFFGMLDLAMTITVPMALVALLNIAIIAELVKNREISDTPAGYVKAQNRQVTKTLITVTSLYLITRLPFIIFGVIRSRSNRFHHIFTQWVGLTYTIFISNYSYNIFIFIFTGKKYRDILKKFFMDPRRYNENSTASD